MRIRAVHRSAGVYILVTVVLYDCGDHQRVLIRVLCTLYVLDEEKLELLQCAH